MKYLILMLILAVGGLVYLRSEQPTIWNQYLAALKAPDNSVGTPATSLSFSPPPAPVAPTPATPPSPSATTSTETANSEHVTPVEQPPQPPAPTPESAVSSDAGAAPTVFVPPNPLPAQANWTWNVKGKQYTNVVVTKVEADQVHIMYDGGVGAIDIADLTPDLQKMLNYDPQLAMQAIKARADDQAKIDAQQATLAAQQAKQNVAEQAMQDQYQQDQAAKEKVSVAKDQRIQYLADEQQMEAAHQVNVQRLPNGDLISVSPRFEENAPDYGSGQYSNGGAAAFWVDKYKADEKAIKDCDQIINTGGK